MSRAKVNMETSIEQLSTEVDENIELIKQSLVDIRKWKSGESSRLMMVKREFERQRKLNEIVYRLETQVTNMVVRRTKSSTEPIARDGCGLLFSLQSIWKKYSRYCDDTTQVELSLPELSQRRIDQMILSQRGDIVQVVQQEVLKKQSEVSLLAKCWAPEFYEEPSTADKLFSFVFHKQQIAQCYEDVFLACYTLDCIWHCRSEVLSRAEAEYACQINTLAKLVQQLRVIERQCWNTLSEEVAFKLALLPQTLTEAEAKLKDSLSRSLSIKKALKRPSSLRNCGISALSKAFRAGTQQTQAGLALFLTATTEVDTLEEVITDLGKPVGHRADIELLTTTVEDIYAWKKLSNQSLSLKLFLFFNINVAIAKTAYATILPSLVFIQNRYDRMLRAWNRQWKDPRQLIILNQMLFDHQSLLKKVVTQEETITILKCKVVQLHDTNQLLLHALSRIHQISVLNT